ncbi:hypothetical protein K443DRAFT_115705 [Laccaria amethystina LaAM-08-1]|uniref:Uncharacterized protein n=1 Tax=Laccaria amethystina LaAM-08-1 TaxID=1095629 RepID=A0A0C9WMD1_9AGAR|nr:hypothetical protein K443DRAFT_115705 [Laccaria amethystina LaAM-08-1]
MLTTPQYLNLPFFCDPGLVWIPPHSINMLHKTAYTMNEIFHLLWSVLHDLGLIQIPSHSVKTLDKTVYETVEPLWR